MTLLNSIKTLMISPILLSGCATPTGPQAEADCPPGFVRFEDEDTDKWGCVSEDDWEEFLQDSRERW